MILLLLASFSNATPLQYNHQGRLLDIEGNGLSGEHELTFRIVDASDSVLWEESLDIEFENGYYSVHLGEDGPTIHWMTASCLPIRYGWNSP